MSEAQTIAVGAAVAAGVVMFAIALYAARRSGPRVTTIETRREEEKDGE